MASPPEGKGNASCRLGRISSSMEVLVKALPPGTYECGREYWVTAEHLLNVTCVKPKQRRSHSVQARLPKKAQESGFLITGCPWVWLIGRDHVSHWGKVQ